MSVSSFLRRAWYKSGLFRFLDKGMRNLLWCQSISRRWHLGYKLKKNSLGLLSGSWLDSHRECCWLLSAFVLLLLLLFDVLFFELKLVTDVSSSTFEKAFACEISLFTLESNDIFHSSIFNRHVCFSKKMYKWWWSVAFFLFVLPFLTTVSKYSFHRVNSCKMLRNDKFDE